MVLVFFALVAVQVRSGAACFVAEGALESVEEMGQLRCRCRHGRRK